MTYRIAEVAELVGVPPTTLRYYEDIGLVEAPARGANGYRTYTDDDVDRLRFITATKGLGIPLSDVAELVRASSVEDCSAVAHQVVELVAARLTETQARIRELESLAEELQKVADRLSTARTTGRCDATCPCATAPALPARAFVELTRPPGRTAGRPAT